MKRILGIGVLLVLIFTKSTYAQNDFCSIKNRAINNGEQLVYTVYYNVSAIWVAAGQAKFTTNLINFYNTPVFHIVGNGYTFKSYDWIFRVRDVYQTYVDTATLLPLKFVRNVDEGGYKINNLVLFNRDKNTALSDKKNFKVPNCVQDVLSTIYYARNIDYNKYKPGAKIPFTMFLDNEVFNLYIRYLGKEKITTKYGTFNAIKLAPLLIKGTIFEGGEKMRVWISDDENHIPLRIDSPILVGSIKVDMTSYSKLRNPLSSLIKKK